MDIKIFGRKELEQFVINNPKQYDVVYYTHSESPKIALIEQNAVESLHMPIDDIDHYELKMHVSATAPDVERFLTFGTGRKKLVVACAAGVSRSSSTAYLIAAQESGASFGLKVLQPGYHFPNRLIVYIGSKLLDNPAVWTEYVAWMRNWNSHDPSQGGQWPNYTTISKMGFDKLKNRGKI